MHEIVNGEHLPRKNNQNLYRLGCRCGWHVTDDMVRCLHLADTHVSRANPRPGFAVTQESCIDTIAAAAAMYQKQLKYFFDCDVIRGYADDKDAKKLREMNKVVAYFDTRYAYVDTYASGFGQRPVAPGAYKYSTMREVRRRAQTYADISGRPQTIYHHTHGVVEEIQPQVMSPEWRAEVRAAVMKSGLPPFIRGILLDAYTNAQLKIAFRDASRWRTAFPGIWSLSQIEEAITADTCY